MTKCFIHRWRVEKLGELVSIKTGKLDSNAAISNGQYPFFTCSRDTLRIDTYSFDCECVLLAGNNAAGIYPIKYFRGKFDAYQRTYILRSTDDRLLSNRFLFYALQPKLDMLKSISTGATTKFLTLAILRDLDISIPPRTTQAQIASILSAYDDLIENNLRRIKLLEEMAQTLYREWFVKFRFPGHEKVRMVDSSLGEIPEGWGVRRLDEIVAFQNRGISAGSHLQGKVYLPIDRIPRKSLSIQETRSWEEAKSSLHLFDEGDILFGAMRPYFHKVIVAPIDGVTRKTCFVFKNRRREYHAFCALTLFQEPTVAFATAHSKGATIPYAAWPQALDGMPVVVPKSSVAGRFEEVVRPMLRELRNTFFRNRNLRQTRDLLLPKLISGDLDVSNLDIAIPKDAA